VGPSAPARVSLPGPDDPTGRHERVARPAPDWDDEPVTAICREKLRRLRLGEQFIYVFDLGDDWAHLCTVNAQRSTRLKRSGITTSEMPGPIPFFGWGDIPDQYGRRWVGDTDDEDPVPPDTDCADLPPLRPGRGPQSRRKPGGTW